MYIHYGNSKFIPEKFNEITNRPFISKPNGGFWACKKDYEFGWKQWCMCEGYNTEKLDVYFEFELKNNAKILKIHSHKDLENLPKLSKQQSYPTETIVLDFEKISEKCDAIEVLISEDNQLYWNLYDWDCDSILVMNKDIIKV